jgi:penicillin-binding protein 1A
VGNDDASTLGPKETGAKAALPIWMHFMQAALEGQTQQYFDIPDAVRQVYIIPKSGEILDAGHRKAVPIIVRGKGEGKK